MKLIATPAPSRTARATILSLEPWQLHALDRLREEYGVDADALVRAGLTAILALVAAAANDPAGARERLAGAGITLPIRHRATP